MKHNRGAKKSLEENLGWGIITLPSTGLSDQVLLAADGWPMMDDSPFSFEELIKKKHISKREVFTK